ncbi:hypothetical protein sp82g_219 [Bacillus phage SP82G]|nr:hypothetical protein sp82g_219 [Bacillus phage SP82G]
MNLNNLEKYSKKELMQIYRNLNNWKWDYRLGEKPKGWDNLPNKGAKLELASKQIYTLSAIQRIQERMGIKRLHLEPSVIMSHRKGLVFELWWILFKLRDKIEYRKYKKKLIEAEEFGDL